MTCAAHNIKQVGIDQRIFDEYLVIFFDGLAPWPQNFPVVESDTLTFSYSSLKALFKRFPKLQEELEPLATPKTVYRFGAKKPGTEDEGEDE